MSAFKDLKKCRESRLLSEVDVGKMTAINIQQLKRIENQMEPLSPEIAEKLVHRYCLIGCPKFSTCGVPNILGLAHKQKLS